MCPHFMEEKVKKTRQGNKKNEVGKKAAQNQFFSIVGVGASAGGLEAFEQLFSKMPPDSGIASYAFRTSTLPMRA